MVRWKRSQRENKKAGRNFSSYGNRLRQTWVRAQLAAVSARSKHRTTKHRRTGCVLAAQVPSVLSNLVRPSAFVAFQSRVIGKGQVFEALAGCPRDERKRDRLSTSEA